MKLRLPFALGLAMAMASVTLAGINLWPFTPPGRRGRAAASDATGASPELRRWLEDSLYSGWNPV